MVVLPPIHTDEGLETRMLLAEVRGPGEPGYNQTDALLAMQWMHVIVKNRLERPTLFGAHKATLQDIIKAPNQFAGFGRYPVLDPLVQHNVEAKLHIANAEKDRRAPSYQAYINAAIATAKLQIITDPSPGKLLAWRTAGASSPGDNFTFFRTLLGNDYYYMPVS